MSQRMKGGIRIVLFILVCGPLIATEIAVLDYIFAQPSCPNNGEWGYVRKTYYTAEGAEEKINIEVCLYPTIEDIPLRRSNEDYG